MPSTSDNQKRKQTNAFRKGGTNDLTLLKWSGYLCLWCQLGGSPMTIHSEFWKERNDFYRANTFGPHLHSVRDAKRQRSYNAEFKELRPLQTSFDRQAAKGYARLCAKIAIRKMREMGLIKHDSVAEAVRESFKAAFTGETIGHCNANCSGAYFAKWGWTDCIIAHEVAHWADQWEHKLAASPGQNVYYEPHGPKWRGWFAFLFGTAGIKASRITTECQIEWVRSVFINSRLQVTMPGA